MEPARSLSRTLAERQSELLKVIRARGEVRVAEMPEMFSVSEETVRRDLRWLEAQQMIQRSYGVARAVESGLFETRLEDRAASHLAEKERIAAAAVTRLGEAQTLYIDEGFNPQLVAKRLPLDRALTVVTPSLPTALLMAQRPNVRVIILGGRVRSHTLGVVDETASQMLSALTVDVAIMGANAVSVDRGMSTPDPAVAVIKRAAMRAAIRRIFIGAHTKFGLASFVRFADVSEFEVLITGVEFPATRANAFRAVGTALLRV
ncbi:MAG: DeoR/GlpR family DNA-binding transcription regulator [Bifidobacteriaceae bacterium]|jgi:DeoR/GlpR family transcriptional regulator of sugar metabolism|nr:DeoR/GlpR family DNA-binding transcription regulator [Bifidobacteriaceae bacterium]